MHNLYKQVRFVYFIVDIALISLSFFLVFKANPDLVPHNLSGTRQYLSIYCIWGIILIFALHNSHLYFTNRYLNISSECFKVSKCVLFSSIAAVVFIFAMKISVFSRVVFAESALSLLMSLSIWRTAKRIYIRYLILNKGYMNYNVVIVGAGRVGLSLLEEIRSFPYLGIKIIGFLDDDRPADRQGVTILGKLSDIEQVVKKYFIDEIYITIPSERKVAAEIIQKGTKLGRTVKVVAEHFGLPYRQVKLDYIGTIPLMTYFEKTMHGAESLSKRLLDIVVSGIILTLLLPAFAIIAFLIKLESPGPVFYIAKRSGKKGVAFNFYKFRSMIVNADTYKEALKEKSEVDGPIFKIREDPRLTKIGKFLRKYSIDELPQLFNVLKGDMSLVGPRPFPVEESRMIEYKHIPRLNIKPGITGMAQIKGRSDLSFSHWMRWDFWYLNNWSLGLDVKILWWTIAVILKGKGAY